MDKRGCGQTYHLIILITLHAGEGTVKGKERKGTWTAPIVSISTTKRSDVDHTELPANTPHLLFLRISIR